MRSREKAVDGDQVVRRVNLGRSGPYTDQEGKIDLTRGLPAWHE